MDEKDYELDGGDGLQVPRLDGRGREVSRDDRESCGSEKVRRGAAILYAVLESNIVGEAAIIVSGAIHQNGFESWRQLSIDREPEVVDKKFMLLGDIVHPEFGSPLQFAGKYRAWLRQCNLYKRLVGKEIEDDMLISVLVRKVPEPLREYLHLHAADYVQSFSRLHTMVVNWLRSKRLWAERDDGGACPMEIDVAQMTTVGRDY